MVNGAGGQTWTSNGAGSAIVGKTIAGRYRIEAVVDEGGEAVVYEARHEALGKRVALKLLHVGPGRSKDASERFLARAKLAASLTGPHVNRISDFGQSAEGNYVVMDWLEGEPMSAWIARSEPLSLDAVLDVVDQVGRALGGAHERGVVHGSIEARCLLRVKQGDEERIKVLGFGERADAEGEGVRVDVRALGTLLLDLASRAQFDGVTTFAVRRQREPELDATIVQKVRKLPAALQAIVVKALAPQSGKTYRRVEDLSGDLERFRAGEIPDALLEMIASGSWALIPEEKRAAAAIERAVAAREVPKAKPAAVRTAPLRAVSRKSTRLPSQQTMLVVGLVAGGLAAGWFVSGLFAPPDEPGAARGAAVGGQTSTPDE